MTNKKGSNASRTGHALLSVATTWGGITLWSANWWWLSILLWFMSTAYIISAVNPSYAAGDGKAKPEKGSHRKQRIQTTSPGVIQIVLLICTTSIVLAVATSNEVIIGLSIILCAAGLWLTLFLVGFAIFSEGLAQFWESVYQRRKEIRKNVYTHKQT